MARALRVRSRRGSEGRRSRAVSLKRRGEKVSQGAGVRALRNVKRYFPQVKHVRDAKEPLDVHVSLGDVKNSKRKALAGCALAVACKRENSLDGAIVSRARVYLIKGDEAVRYKTGCRIEREIVSFDRGAGFEPGEYTLPVPGPTEVLDRTSHGGGQHKPNRGIRKKPHMTTQVRDFLGREHTGA